MDKLQELALADTGIANQENIDFTTVALKRVRAEEEEKDGTNRNLALAALFSSLLVPPNNWHKRPFFTSSISQILGAVMCDMNESNYARHGHGENQMSDRGCYKYLHPETIGVVLALALQ